MNRFFILLALTALLASSAAFSQDTPAAQQQNQLNQSPNLQHPAAMTPEPSQCRMMGKFHHWGAKRPLFFIICLLVNILTAVWVYQDIKIRHVGSGIWVVIALLTGLFGAFVYAIVRLGDTPKPTT
jgi:hypothetical protein